MNMEKELFCIIKLPECCTDDHPYSLHLKSIAIITPNKLLFVQVYKLSALTCCCSVTVCTIISYVQKL